MVPRKGREAALEATVAKADGLEQLGKGTLPEGIIPRRIARVAGGTAGATTPAVGPSAPEGDIPPRIPDAG